MLCTCYTTHSTAHEIGARNVLHIRTLAQVPGALARARGSISRACRSMARCCVKHAKIPQDIGLELFCAKCTNSSPGLKPQDIVVEVAIQVQDIPKCTRWHENRSANALLQADLKQRENAALVGEKLGLPYLPVCCALCSMGLGCAVYKRPTAEGARRNGEQDIVVVNT